jgi:Protein of unknown function (DUF3467)
MAEDKPGAPSEEAQALRVLAESTLGRGVYSNLVIVSHTAEEFILDFLLQVRGGAQLVSRVILSPAHAGRLVDALKANLEKREQAQHLATDKVEGHVPKRKGKAS